MSIELVDGKPEVEWVPKTNRWTGVELNAVLKGAVTLDGPWRTVTEANKARFRFFKAVVLLGDVDDDPDDPHDMVQLWEGGPYWATTNIGAEKPEDYGYYFWWGDTVGYRRVNNAWTANDGSSASFSFSSGNVPTYSKSIATLQSGGWITTDGVLAPEHDVAQVHWGGKWRMPTDQEMSGLNSNCDWTWTTMNGVNGYVVCGRGDYASASIFLPAAGTGSKTSLNSAGSIGIYWSSVPDSDSDKAWRLGFSLGSRYTDAYGRYRGQSVRPVRGFAQ